MPEGRHRDEQALVLRDQGLSFAGIAQELDLAGAIEANAAFNRALRLRSPAEQSALRGLRCAFRRHRSLGCWPARLPAIAQESHRL